MLFSDRRSLGLIHLAALAVVIGFSIHAVRARPATRLVGQAKVNAGTTLTDRFNQAHSAWDMDLRIDGTVKPPGWSWILHEGKRPGAGYELHWLADQQVLQVRRARPEAFLLGSAHLANPPARVSFQRRGGLLTALIDDDLILRCLDPDGPLEEGAHDWGCSTAGTLGEATFTVQTVDQSLARWGASPRGIHSDGPFLAVAAACRATGSDEEIARAFGQAREQLGARRGITDAEQPGRALAPADRTRLHLWLSLARIRWQLAASDSVDSGGFDGVSDEIDTLFTATDHERSLLSSAPAPEIAGMLMSLTGPLARRAVAIPTQALTRSATAGNDLVFAHRARWLDLLAQVTARTLELAGSSLAPDDARQLQLLLHAVSCLRRTTRLPDTAAVAATNREPLPVPLDGPSWLISRWRAFAGGDPGVDSFPPLGGSGGPVTVAIDLLTDDSDLEPVPALALRRLVSDRIERRDRLLDMGKEGDEQRRKLEDEALRACENLAVPLRERLLTRALVVLHLAEARSELLQPLRDALTTSDLVNSDPLAFALDQLILRRHGARIGAATESALPDQARIKQFFPEYQVLMDSEKGLPAAVARIWRVRLPHAQALAVALIMREVSTYKADWRLLDGVPGFTLPLPLLQRVGAPAASSGGAGIAPGSGIAP